MATRWRVLNRRRRRAAEAGPRCETCGTRNGVLECQFHPWEKPHAYLCPTHAQEDGFCGGCGLFWSGVESFDFGRFPGYCDNCQDEIAFNDWHDEDDFMYDFEFDPELGEAFI